MTQKPFQSVRHFFRETLLTTRGVVLALVLCGVIAHGVALGGSFKSMDDQTSIIDNQNLRSFSSLGRIFTGSFFGDDRTYYRPLVTASFLLDYQIAALRPWFYYLTNLLLHLANAILLFFIFEVLLQKRALSFSAALLFVVHPIHWEAVANIAGRSILLCAFWQLTAFLLYLRYAVRSRLDPQRKLYYAGSLLAFVLALLSKESAVVLPFLIAGYEYWLGRKSKGKILPVRPAKRLLGFLPVLAGYFLLRKFLGMTNVAFWPSLEQLFFGVLTFVSSVLVYLRVFLLPVDLHFDRTTAYFTNFADWSVWLTLAAIVIFGWMAGHYHRQWSHRAKFLLFWFGATLVPVSQLVPLPAHPGYAATADHFYYIPSAGLFAFFVLAACAVFERIIWRKTISKPSGFFLAVTVFVYFFLISVGQHLHAVHELSMFKRSLEYDPYNTRVRNSYALALAKVRLFAEAEQEFRKVLKNEPWDIRARIGLAKSLCDQGKCLAAVFEYEAISDAGSMQDLLESNLMFTYEVVIWQYQKLLEQQPPDSQLHYSLGVMYAKTGRSREAIREYLQALRLDPRSRPALYNLGALLESTPQPEKAIPYFKKVIALDRGKDQLSEYAYRHLSKIHELKGQRRRARAYFRAAERIAGGDASLKTKSIMEGEPLLDEE